MKYCVRTAAVTYPDEHRQSPNTVDQSQATGVRPGWSNVPGSGGTMDQKGVERRLSRERAPVTRIISFIRDETDFTVLI